MPDEVVVITGASAGVGRATVRKFAREGARIGLIARGSEGLKAARRDAEVLGAEAVEVEADVADHNELEEAASHVESKLGPPDIWINNAMTSVLSPAKDMEVEEFKRVTEVTYLGYVYGTLIALRSMLPRNRGTIVQVGSALAYRGIPLQSAYCAAKHAIQGFTESVRCELMHDHSGVHLTMVNLPALNTPQFDWVLSRMPRHPMPVPPVYQPEVAASAIWWAAHHRRRELNVGITTSLTILADKIIPGALDRYLGLTGYKSQQDDRPRDTSQANLWDPVDVDMGAHGDFDAEAKDSSAQLWASINRGKIGAAAAIVAAALVASRRSRTS